MTLKVNEDGQLEIQVGEETKTLSTEDINDALKKSGELGEVSKVAELISTAAGKYEADPETYIGQAEGAFATVRNLIEAGVIDEQGKIVTKKEEPKTTPKGAINAPLDTKDLDPEKKMEGIIAKAIAPFQEKIKSLENDVSLSRRLDLEDKLKAKHPSLDSDDISKVFAIAMRDQTKNLWEHADLYEGKVKEKVKGMEAKWAEKYGVNPEEWDNRNKMKEMSPAEGMAFVTKGKKISIHNRQGDKNAVTPLQAARAFFKRQAEG